MSTVDLAIVITTITSNVASIFFGWQQNQIFREQNVILAAPAGAAMPKTSARVKLGLYWPAIVAVLLAASVFAVLTKFGAGSVAVPWALVTLLTFGTTLSVMRLKSSLMSQQFAIAENANLKQQLDTSKSSIAVTKPSKLVIHFAEYRAPQRWSAKPDVTDCLRHMIVGDSLILEIQNGNFWVGDKNYVPNDPCEGKKKWLHVEYSFDGRPQCTIQRPEGYRLVLPEDTFVKEEIDRIQDETRRENAQKDSELSRAQESRRQCDEERRAALAKIDEFEQAKNNSGIDVPLSPLQIEAFKIAKELRDFLEELPPFPENPEQDHDESDYDYITRMNASERLQQLFATRREEQGRWRQKLIYGYTTRQFAQRITTLICRVGEEFDYFPAANPNYAENIDPSENGIRKRAQEMEMIAIGINRKVRNEVDLLRTKP